VAEDREAYEQGLRLSLEHEDDFDPLLGEISAARNAMLAAEARLLVAYGREFTRPRPYRLEDLARAAGMSISGVRTAYDADEIAEVTRLTGGQAGPPPRGSPGDRRAETRLRVRPFVALPDGAHRGWRRRRRADGHAWRPGLPLTGALLLLRGDYPARPGAVRCAGRSVTRSVAELGGNWTPPGCKSCYLAMADTPRASPATPVLPVLIFSNTSLPEQEFSAQTEKISRVGSYDREGTGQRIVAREGAGQGRDGLV